MIDLVVFLKKEKTGRRFCGCGGELFGTGDEGGLDRGASSDHVACESFGLDVGGSEDVGADAGISACDLIVCDVGIVVATVTGALSTRLRLVGGSSS